MPDHYFPTVRKALRDWQDAMGNLRAAVIPYSIAVLYSATDGKSDGDSFDFGSIWKEQDIQDDLAGFFERLMRLMNELIKHYSMSDDYGEYSKKPELWAAISASPEIKSFLENPENLAVIERYTSIKG